VPADVDQRVAVLDVGVPNRFIPGSLAADLREERCQRRSMSEALLPWHLRQIGLLREGAPERLHEPIGPQQVQMGSNEPLNLRPVRLTQTPSVARPLTLHHGLPRVRSPDHGRNAASFTREHPSSPSDWALAMWIWVVHAECVAAHAPSKRRVVSISLRMRPSQYIRRRIAFSPPRPGK
jgi:hypothetical protein